MALVFGKIFSVFLIVFIGVIASKIKWLPVECSPYLSKMMIQIAGPCLAIYSMSTQLMTPESLKSVLQTILLMFFMMCFCGIVSIPIIKILEPKQALRGVHRLLLVCTNCGLVGFPLANEIFGSEGLFLMAIANAVFSIFTYTIGIVLLLYDRNEAKQGFLSSLKAMISVPMIAAVIGFILFFFQWKLPYLIENMFSVLGNMATPLSMILIGVQLSNCTWKAIIANKKLLITALLRLIILPAILFFLFLFFGFMPFVLCIVTFAMSMPSGAIIPVLSQEHGCDTQLAAQGVFITTLFSLITLPVVAMLLVSYLNGQ